MKEEVMETPEVRRERFQRLAVSRTNEVLKKLEILGHCANRHTYEYTAEEARKMFLAIEQKLNEVKIKFKDAEEKTFRL